MVLCLTCEVDKIEIANSYIKCSCYRQEAFAMAYKIGIFFFFESVMRARSARNALRGKAHEK